MLKLEEHTGQPRPSTTADPFQHDDLTGGHGTVGIELWNYHAKHGRSASNSSRAYIAGPKIFGTEAPSRCSVVWLNRTLSPLVLLIYCVKFGRCRSNGRPLKGAITVRVSKLWPLLDRSFSWSRVLDINRVSTSPKYIDSETFIHIPSQRFWVIESYRACRHINERAGMHDLLRCRFSMYRNVLYTRLTWVIF